MALKVLISGGGTGGHIYPGISLAYELKKRDVNNDILFIGTERGLESKLIPREGFKFLNIKAKGVQRKICLENFIAIIIFIVSSFQSYRIIKKYKPDLAIGTGGYVSGSVILVAFLMGIPTFIHEQNVIPGITNKFLSFIVKEIFLSFEQSRRYFKKKSNLFFTGNPIRFKNLENQGERNYQKFNLDSFKKTILVFGGSKGSAAINRAVIEGIGLVNDLIKNQWQVLLISGVDDYEKIIEIIGNNNNMYSVKSYLYDIEEVYALADLVVCRAGATTLAEINAYGLPAILIPYPYATDNHQEINARALEREGAALMILEKDLTGEKLAKILIDLLRDKAQLEIMAKKSKKIGNKDSAKKVIDFIFDYLKKV